MCSEARDVVHQASPQERIATGCVEPHDPESIDRLLKCITAQINLDVAADEQTAKKT
jgi:hypothetical protein